MHAPAASGLPATGPAGSRNPGCSGSEHSRADGSLSRQSPPTSRAERLEYALSPEGLYEALGKCASGTRWKRSVGSMELNAWERCIDLSRRLNDGTYEPRAPTHFTVTHPKPRQISAIGIADRVYQRSLNDNVVYPAIASSLIKENCACQPGKGPDYARDLFARQLRRWHSHHGREGGCLCTDVRGYYPRMPHWVAEDMFARHLDGEALDRVLAILHHQYPGDVGYDPGSQLLQIAGIAVLSPVDHMCKELLGCREYLRYMDDCRILGTREHLHEVRDAIGAWLVAHDMALNDTKTRVIPLTEPIPFLGFTFRLTETGRVEVRALNVKMREKRSSMRHRIGAVRDGRMSREVVDGMAAERVRYLKQRCTGSADAMRLARWYEKQWED